jgi:quinol monooxygenase YgiN
MIHVLAIITAKPGKRGEVLAAFEKIVPVVRKEDGCIEYGAAVDAEGMGPTQSKLGTDTYVVVEKWTSPATLAAHSASPHMAEFRAKTKDLMASRVIHVLSPV